MYLQVVNQLFIKLYKNFPSNIIKCVYLSLYDISAYLEKTNHYIIVKNFINLNICHFYFVSVMLYNKNKFNEIVEVLYEDPLTTNTF